MSLTVGSEQSRSHSPWRAEFCVMAFMRRSVSQPHRMFAGSCVWNTLSCQHTGPTRGFTHPLDSKMQGNCFPEKQLKNWSQIIYSLTLTVSWVDSHSRVPQIRTVLETGPTQILDVRTHRDRSGPPSLWRESEANPFSAKCMWNTTLSSFAFLNFWNLLNLQKYSCCLILLYFLLFHWG